MLVIVFSRSSGLNSFAKVNFHSALNCDARQHFSRLFSFSHAIILFFSFSCRYAKKELVYALAVYLSSHGCTSEVWKALVKLRR